MINFVKNLNKNFIYGICDYYLYIFMYFFIFKNVKNHVFLCYFLYFTKSRNSLKSTVFRKTNNMRNNDLF